MTPTPPLSPGAARVQAMQEAEALTARLHAHFAIRYPLRVTWASNRGRAYNRDLKKGRLDYRVNLSTVSPMGILPLAMHEFAHILDFDRNGRSDHNLRFFNLLLDVLTVAGLAPKDYPWEREYATLNAFARQARYTTQPTVKQARAKAASLVGAKNGVRPGVLVHWSSPKHGHKTGTVISAQRGCRAKIAVAGLIWYVPQDWLTVVPPVATVPSRP